MRLNLKNSLTGYHINVADIHIMLLCWFELMSIRHPACLEFLFSSQTDSCPTAEIYNRSTDLRRMSSSRRLIIKKTLKTIPILKHLLIVQSQSYVPIDTRPHCIARASNIISSASCHQSYK